jgi:lactate dehydrogenase-like 2-hydroxyacid dehydrogenase
MMKKIYVTRRIDETGINLLRKKHSVFMSFKHTSPSKKELLKRVKNVDAIICTLSERIDSDVMDAAGDNLRVISTLDRI